jgi:rhomboid-related protein 1/2/3
MLVYISGVLAGSLWTSVIKPGVFLSGASGGVYALITAHLGTVIMNFREMTCPWCRILVVVVVAMSDIIVYVYNMYVVGHSSPVSYPAHISGAVTGLLVGITALKNLRWERYERYIWVASILTFVVLMLTAIVWSVAAPMHFTGLAPELVTCISEREL